MRRSTGRSSLSRSTRATTTGQAIASGATGRPATGDRVRLSRMPAQQALAALPAGSISVLVTDPPYTSVDRRSGSGHLRRWFRGGLTWAEIGRILALARRRMRSDGVAFVMTNGDGLPEAQAAMARAGFVRVRPITWDRRYPGLGGGLRHQTEFVLVGLLPGSRTLHGVDLIAVAAVGPGTAGRYPTEKPEGLGCALAAIAGVGPGDLVVDPFCGSGALLVGANARGARVIGSDIAAAAIARARSKLGVGRATAPTGRGNGAASAPPPTRPSAGTARSGHRRG